MLKGIELFGFKTFAERARLEFGPGITAIVGPNGVGKTNLVEAFLWVLGETSARALRSTKASDLIFNGSGGKRPLSLAEVSLLLDNSSGLLPLPFSEVAITRRVLKSGESQYLLNGAECRARDLLPLLAELGLSRRSFVVLTQGELEAVLSQRPEDRRALLESIAGTARYKIRREEAMGKLERTKTDIERLSDIIAEVEAQLFHLSEQAQKAERYLEISKERNELRATLLARELLSARQRRARAEKEAEEVKEELDALRGRVEALKAEIERRRNEWEAARNEADSLRLRASEVALRAERLEAEVAALKERLVSLHREGAEATERAEELRERARRLAAEVERLSEELQAKEGVLSKAEEALKEAEEEAKAALEKVERARSDLEALLERRLEAARRAASLRNSLRSTEEESSRLRAKRGEAEERLKAAEERAAKLREEEEALDLEKQRLLERLSKARAQVAGLEGNLKKAREGLAEAQKAKEKVRSELGALEAEREGLRRSLEAWLTSPGVAPQGKKLADLLEVEPGLEEAAEAALGRLTFALVAQSVEEAVRLFETGADCVVLLESPEVKPPEGFERLMSFVKGEGAPVVEAFCVCSPGAIREALRASLKNPSVRLVASDGSFFVERGALCRPEAKSGIFALKRRSEELDRKVEASRGALAKAEMEVERCSQKVRAAERELEEAKQREVELSQKVTEVHSRLSLIRAEMERDEEALKSTKAELETLKNQERRTQREVGQLAILLAEAEREEEELKRASLLLSGEVSRLSASASEASKRAGDARAYFERLQAEVEGLCKLGEERRERMSTLLEEAELSTAKVASLEVEAQRLKGKLGALTKEAEEARSEAARLSQEAEEAASRAYKLGEETARLEGELRAALERGAKLEADWGRIQSRSSEAKASEEALRRRIEEAEAEVERAIARAKRISLREMETRLAEIREEMELLGPVNLAAAEEYRRTKERLDNLLSQREDLTKAEAELGRLIRELDEELERRFRATLEGVAQAFDEVFQQLFGGGETRLVETEPRRGEEGSEPGVDIEVRLPGKRRQNMLALSGGERALTAIAFLFGLLKVRPVPFCVLDEVDAALDNVNTKKFVQLLDEFSFQGTQFVIVTHNRGTMEAADCLYGVTMDEPGVSKVVSVRLEWAVRA